MAGMEGFSIIFEQPGSTAKSPPFSDKPGFRPRRFHHKSRNGCTSCKRRRIKCDEAQPACSRCWEKGIACQYRKSPEPSECARNSLPTPPEDDVDIDEAIAVNSRMLEMLEQENVRCKIFVCPNYDRSDALALFHHFFDMRDTTWIASPVCQNVLQEHGFTLAQNAPYLMHAILAFSAAHMNSLAPQESTYSVASALHYHRSLRLYQDHLSSDLKEEDADALFACSILHSILAFVHAPVTGPESGMHVDNGTPCWILTFQGNHILLNTPMFRPPLLRGVWSSIIGSFLQHGNDMHDPSLPLNPNKAEDMAHINAVAQICAELPPEEKTLCEEPIANLRDLVQFAARPELLGRFIYFMTRLQPAFLLALRAHVPCAVMVLGFWCAYVSRIDQWWIAAAAPVECRRICDVLRSLEGGRFITQVRYLKTFYTKVRNPRSEVVVSNVSS